MKATKKLLALALTIIMVLTLASTALAVDITIGGGAAGAEYAAFKLLHAVDLHDNKFAYTVNETYRAVLQSVIFDGRTDDDKWETAEDVTDDEIIDRISELKGGAVQDFADQVFKQIKLKGMDPDYATENDKFTGVEQGYYLIAETKTGDTADTFSLVMLDTAGQKDITIAAKEDQPTLEKKVQDKNDSTGDVSDWRDTADYDIGDDVPFMLTGTVSDQYDRYETYAYTFHDKMSAGLTFNANSVVVQIDGHTVPVGSYTVVTEGLEAGCTFEVRFADLKTVVAEGDYKAAADSKITVEFTAKLNENAEIGNPGNPNEAYLEYSNNPYGNETGKTPEDKVVVFTFKLVADKVDGNGDKLAGAGFTLYKEYAGKNDAGEVTYEWLPVGEEITGVTTFTFTGLDAGEYKLVETTVPAGYNKADNLVFEVVATYKQANDAEAPLTLESLEIRGKDGAVISGEGGVFTTNITAGSVNTTVVNLSGTKLPSTGGIGTTIFYIVGGLLMVGAVVLLVTRKRMTAYED